MCSVLLFKLKFPTSTNQLEGTFCSTHYRSTSTEIPRFTLELGEAVSSGTYAICYVLRAARTRNKIEANYFLHGQKLQVVDSGLYLAVILQSDGDLSEQHTQKVTTGGSKLLGFFWRNLKINSKTIKDQAYKMLLRSKLECVWEPHKKDTVSVLERIQHAARIPRNTISQPSPSQPTSCQSVIGLCHNLQCWHSMGYMFVYVCGVCQNLLDLT